MAFKKRISPEDAIRVLNEMLEADPRATKVLVENRVPCNKDLAEHPTIQCGAYPDGEGPVKVGLMGVINGLFGADDDGWGCIAAIVEEDGQILRFERIRK